MDERQAEISNLIVLNMEANDDPAGISALFETARRVTANPDALPGDVKMARAMAEYWKSYCHENGMDDIVPETGTPAHGWLFQTPQ